MIRILCLSFLVIASAAFAEEVPRLNIEATCRAAQPLSSDDKNVYQNCMRSENEARSELERQWSSAKVSSRENCLKETSIGDNPSYVEVLTCIQMYEGNLGTPATRPARPGTR